MFPPINVADDGENQPTVHPSPKFEVMAAEERELTGLAHSTASISGKIRRVEDALEGGTPYLGTRASAILFGELSSLRRERALLLEKDVRLQQRMNLLLTRDKDGSGKAASGSTDSENEDERILQRVDSFSILIVVSTLVTGFSIPTIDQAQLGITRTLMTLVFALEMFATIFFSIISFYAKQAFNYGSTNNQRTARFLYRVRWITFSAQACYTIGICLFVAAILLEATLGYDSYWALAGVVPIFVLSAVCWVISAYALVSLRMGLWTRNLLLFDADTKLIDEKRSTFIPAPTSFRDWFGWDDEGNSRPNDNSSAC
ncbi:unnamed protein product [Pylaiella littoralis]